MVHQGQLAIKSFFLTLLFLGCETTKTEINIEISNPSLNLFSSTVLYKDSPLDGKVFSLFGGSIDTLSLQYYKEGLKNGVWKKYYKNGALREKRIYKMGEKEGDYVGFYEDGSINFIFQFYNNEYNGKNRVWSKNGLLIEESNFINGYESGSQKRWYLNGKIKSNYVIKNSRRFGLLGTQNCRNVSKKFDTI